MCVCVCVCLFVCTQLHKVDWVFDAVFQNSMIKAETGWCGVLRAVRKNMYVCVSPVARL